MIMMPGVLISGIDASGKKVDLACIDYGSLIARKGSLVEVRLPEKLEPQAYEDGMFGYAFARVSPGPLGIDLAADAIQQEWRKLEEEGMLLGEAALGLVVVDIVEFIKGIPAQTPGYVHHYFGCIPSFAEVVQLVGHIAELRAFPAECCQGLENRIAELRKHLNGIFRDQRLTVARWPELPEFVKVISEASIAIASKESEFNVLKQLLKLGHTVRLSKKGADFVIVDQNGLNSEVKSPHENILQALVKKGQTQGIIGPDPISLSPESFFALMSWALFGTIRRAMETQRAQVLFCDLSHRFVGWFFPAIEQFWKMNLDFQDAVKKAFNLAAKGSQVILAFVSLPGLAHHLKAIALERTAVEPIGKLLWDMNKQLALQSPELAKFLSDEFKQEG
jgi:hypothetical protein